MGITSTLTEAPTPTPQRNSADFRTEADAYVDWQANTFVGELNDVIDDFNATIEGFFVATSTTSVAIGTGSKTFTTVEENLAFGAGQQVVVAETSDPTANYMEGVITSWTKSTKELIVSVDSSTGSGTISAWTITVSPPDAVNRVKSWSTLTGAVSRPFIAYHDSTYWTLNDDLADVTSEEPGVSTKWDPFSPKKVEVLTTSQDWSKIPSAKFIFVELVSGGNSGKAVVDTGTDEDDAFGGAGGIYASYLFNAADVSDPIAVVVGAGGAAVVVTSATDDSTEGNVGGVSSFGTFSTSIAKSYRYAALTVPNATRVTYGNYNGGDGGAGATATRANPQCIVGGAGGGGVEDTTAGTGAVSDRHGNGGDAAYGDDADATATAGVAPGGGGGGASVQNATTTRTATSGAGAIGAVRVWQW